MNIATPQEQFESRRRLATLPWKQPEKKRMVATAPMASPALAATYSDEPLPWPCFASDEIYHAAKISISDILIAVRDFYGVSINDIRSARKAALVLEPRYVCYYLAKELTTHSYPEIGRALGGRDHTTILWGYRNALKRMVFDSNFAKSVKTIRAKLEGEAV